MHYLPFSDATPQYDLGAGYALERSEFETTEFVKHWAAYRPNESFHQDWTARYTDIQQVPFRFWITHHGKRVGGCLMLPNVVAELFLIPPFNSYDDIMNLILPLLKAWSVADSPITARYILPDQISPLQRQGFEVVENRVWMIRPTASMATNLPKDYALSTLTVADIDTYADVMTAAFAGGIGEYGQRTHDDHLASLTRLFERGMIDTASACVINTQNNQLVSLIIVTPYAGHASINFVVTHPDYQSMGFGRQMIEYALNACLDHHNWIVLVVTVDNPAVHLYDKLGFGRGTTISTMKLQND